MIYKKCKNQFSETLTEDKLNGCKCKVLNAVIMDSDEQMTEKTLSQEEVSFTGFKEMLCDEIEKIISEGGLSRDRLELLHKLNDTLKNLYKIEMHEESEQGYSRDGGNYSRDRRYSRDNSMDSSYGGNSYDYSGRRHYARGHYSRDEFMDKLVALISDAPSEKDREAIRRCMNLMQNA